MRAGCGRDWRLGYTAQLLHLFNARLGRPGLAFADLLG